jgi:hypothetical protein
MTEPEDIERVTSRVRDSLEESGWLCVPRDGTSVSFFDERIDYSGMPDEEETARWYTIRLEAITGTQELAELEEVRKNVRD